MISQLLSLVNPKIWFPSCFHWLIQTSSRHKLHEALSEGIVYSTSDFNQIVQHTCYFFCITYTIITFDKLKLLSFVYLLYSNFCKLIFNFNTDSLIYRFVYFSCTNFKITLTTVYWKLKLVLNLFIFHFYSTFKKVQY